ncbi:MAG: DUF378 domain-containing protein [Candidatus Kerfeldbacteria bacterium]|nr:DUF378 domain-containing protein [Candidatus Kerfeldbacteria bacterium]
MKMNALDWLFMALLIVGGLNWGLVGFFKYDLVATLVGKEFGEVTTLSQIIYALVGVSALYMIFRPMMKSSPKPMPPQVGMNQ